MVNLQKSGDSAVKIVFTDSDHYLYGNGEIEVPVNSLLLVIDESEMVTFKKLSGDPFLSFRADNSNLGTKAAIEQFYKENMVGAAGISEEEVQDMIDESISGKADTAVVNQAISEATQAILSVSGDVQTKVATSDFNAYSAATETALNAKADTSAVTAVNDALTAHTSNTGIHVTSADKTAWNNKSDFSGDYNDLTNKPTIPTVPTNISDFTNDAGYITNADITGKADTSAVTAAIDDAKAYYISFTTLATVGIHDEDWNGIVAAIDDHRPIYAGYPRTDGGIIYYGVECMNKNSDNTQIVMTASDDNQHYFYTFVKNGSNDYSYTVDTRPYTTNQEKTAWNAKAEPYSAGTGIEISGNVISATGGGGAGLDDDTQQLISTAFNDLNDRKADLKELSKYQKKGDYVETPTLADYMTNDAFDEYATAKERIISGALNDLNDKFGGLRLVKISQTDYDNLATKDNNTLYIINNVI